MKPTTSEDQQVLRRLSRQVAFAVWLSSACLVILLLLLLFPRQAEIVSQSSVNFQDWIAPHMGGVFGLAIALLIVFFAAAYVMSHLSPSAPCDLESNEKQEEY